MTKVVFFRTFGLLLVLAAMQGNLYAAWDPAKVEAREQATSQALADFVATDPGLERFFNESYGYAVFPKVGSAAFIVGGAHGKGEVFEQGKVVGEARITAVTVGLSLGGKKFSEIIFFRNKDVLDRFKGGKLDFGAEISAVVSSKGAAASSVWNGDIAVFTRGEKGLMVDASVGGQKFKFAAY